MNNAGTATDGVLATMPEESIDAMLEVNLRASIMLTKECCREMLRRPVEDRARYDRVWQKEITPLDGAYEMKP